MSFTVLMAAFFVGSPLIAQPLLGSTNLNAGWLWPKGVYTLAIHDGPGPRTEDIAAYLAATGKVADFFQTLCHYTGQPWADQRSAMCFQQHAVPVSLVNSILALHQCVGNHGQDHLSTPTLNQADTIYQIGGPTAFFQAYWEQQNCPALLTFPGFQTDAQHNAWLNQDAGTAGRQQGPIWADFDGSGTVQTASGPVAVGNDQDCFTQGFNHQQCLNLMLGAMTQADHGGIINIHDFNPYALNPLDPLDPKSGYAYDYLVGIISGCQAANNGNPCAWLTPDAIPGVHRGLAVSQFSLVSNSSDDFSDRIAGVLVGDVNNDSLPDVLVPRTDGLYCAINAGNGTLYSLGRCLAFTDSSMVADRYWLVDVDGDGLPYLVWLNSSGLVGAKADGHGGFRSGIRVLSSELSAKKLGDASIYRNSIGFGPLRAGSSLPDLVAMSPLGVVVAINNGNGFDPPRRVPHLAYQGEENSAWTPQQAGEHILLADLSGKGPMSIVIPGKSGLLYSSPTQNGFSAFKPLTTTDGFDYWSSPRIYKSFDGTRIAGRPAIAGWTPAGIAFANFSAANQRVAVDQFQVVCSDCFLSLPGWLDQWQQSSMTSVPFQSGFADFKGNGAPQAFAVWGTGLYAGDVSTLAGYR
jgi:hypothetical protein